MALRFASFELDELRAELRGPGGEPIKMRAKALEMLFLFAANPGRILSKQELMEAVWPRIHVSEGSLYQCILEIRTALGDDQREIIKVVSGKGYLFAIDVTAEPAGPVESTDDVPSDEELQPEAPAEPPVIEAAAEPQKLWRLRYGSPWLAVVTGVVAICAIVVFAAALPLLRHSSLFKRPLPILAVMPIVNAAGDPQGTAVAAGTTDRLIEAFAHIDNIRVTTPQAGPAVAPDSASSAPPDFVLQAELQRSGLFWTLRARMVRTATGEVEATVTASADSTTGDGLLQQTRLAAGIGDPLARRLNTVLERGEPPDVRSRAVTEQVAASIDRITRERFAAAQTMLETSLRDMPENTDLQVALAALQLRGIQMAWYDLAAQAAAERNARSLLERALRAAPRDLPALEAYCRLLTATFQFTDSLLACTRALGFDPWNGAALFNIGVTQLYLGRFEDSLATFMQADRFDVPQVSRWTWLLGAGWVSPLMGQNDDAVRWFQRSIAITPASGRSYFLLAAAYQRMGQSKEAKTAFVKAMELRPGSTAVNVPTSPPHASPVFLEAAEPVMRTLVEMGLPER